MVTERELRLMRGWNKLTKKQKMLVELVYGSEDGIEGSQASIGRMMDDTQPANMVRAIKGLVEYGIIRKELLTSSCVRLTLTEDYDEAIISLGGEEE